MMKWIFGLIFLIMDLHGTQWEGEIVRSYVHSSEVQRRWAWSFLAGYVREISVDSCILDVGCGDGKITADLSRLVPLGSVTGIDVSETMLTWAQKQYHAQEYPNLHFQKGSFLEPGTKELFDWVVTFCAFQHCQEPSKALFEMRKVLKRDGKLLILVPAMDNLAFNQARKRVQSFSRWAPYWENIRPRFFGDGEYYRELLESAGFKVLKIERVETMDPFVDAQEFLRWMQGTFTPAALKDQARAFFTDWIEEYLRLDPSAIDERGVIYAKINTICIEAIPQIDRY